MPRNVRKAATGISAEFKIWEALFEVICRHTVKFVELLLCSSPHRGIFGLIPYLPILNIMIESVCPALIVVADYMLADPCPLVKILWRIDVIRLYIPVVLDSNTKTVKYLRARLDDISDVSVGESEIIVFGIVLVGVKISENIWNINVMCSSKRTHSIVGSHIRNTCIGKCLHRLTKCRGRVIHTVKRLHFRSHLIKIK